MSATADITVDIRAEIRFGAGKAQHVGRRVTANSADPAEDVRNTITLALRQVNDEVRGLIR